MRAASAGGVPSLDREIGDRRGHVHRARPQPHHRDEQERRVHQGAAPVFGREQGEERIARRQADLGRAVLPARRFADAVADERHQQGGRPTHREHGTPAVAGADPVVDDGSQEGADVIPGVHPGRALPAARLRPLLGHEDAADGPLAADSRTRQEPEEAQLPHGSGRASQEREQRIAEDGEHQGADAAEAVRNGPPKKSEAPAGKKHGEQHAAVETHVGLSGCDAGARQQIAQRRDHDQRIQERIHAVQRPTAPGCPEAAHLVGAERRRGGRGHYSTGSEWRSTKRIPSQR